MDTENKIEKQETKLFDLDQMSASQLFVEYPRVVRLAREQGEIAVKFHNRIEELEKELSNLRQPG